MRGTRPCLSGWTFTVCRTPLAPAAASSKPSHGALIQQKLLDPRAPQPTSALGKRGDFPPWPPPLAGDQGCTTGAEAPLRRRCCRERATAPSKARSFFGNSTARFALSARRTATRARPSLKVFASEVGSLLPCPRTQWVWPTSHNAHSHEHPLARVCLCACGLVRAASTNQACSSGKPGDALPLRWWRVKKVARVEQSSQSVGGSRAHRSESGPPVGCEAGIAVAEGYRVAPDG